MKTFSVVETKSRLPALLAEVEADTEMAVTRRGKTAACQVSEHSVAASAFHDFWNDKDSVSLQAPDDMQAEAVASLDD